MGVRDVDEWVRASRDSLLSVAAAVIATLVTLSGTELGLTASCEQLQRREGYIRWRLRPRSDVCLSPLERKLELSTSLIVGFCYHKSNCGR